MSLSESAYEVWLGQVLAGVIHQRGDHTRFVLDQQYRDDPDRAVLGLLFEQDPLRAHSAALRLPPWFSNLLPEGVLRKWIADDRGVSSDREMELLAQVGHDLPGAVQVLPAGSPPPVDPGSAGEATAPLVPAGEHPGWRFSLAGVQLKFSMLAQDDRLTLPAYGEGGDWIVKLPDRQYPDVPRNEFAMMSLAGAAGIEVPELRLVHRDHVVGLPDNVWPGPEEWAYAVRRFDRADGRSLVHIEDLAQVTNVYPEEKYRGNYETVASLLYRHHDTPALVQFARRLAFMVVIGNGDGHLKNWSLIYRDPSRPTLSPAYDLVATAPYRVNGAAEDLGLKFGGSKLFHRVTLRLFARLEERLGATAGLADHAADAVFRARDAWPQVEDRLRENLTLCREIGDGIRDRAKTLLASPVR
jgi:serine/threonine-protein kinase HipA